MEKILLVLISSLCLSPSSYFENGGYEDYHWKIHNNDALVEFLNESFHEYSALREVFSENLDITINIVDSDVFAGLDKGKELSNCIALEQGQIFFDKNVWAGLTLKERLACIAYGIIKKQKPTAESLKSIQRVFGVNLQRATEDVIRGQRDLNIIQESRQMVIALGGNAFVEDGRDSQEDQRKTIRKMMRQIAVLIRLGAHPIFVHGNGPQIGAILADNPDISMPDAGLQTQREIGHMIEDVLADELSKAGMKTPIKSIVSIMLVSDLGQPTKPVGDWLTIETVRRRKRDNPELIFANRQKDLSGDDLKIKEGKIFRQMVFSPIPDRIVQIQDIVESFRHGVVIAAGGGGIPAVGNVGDYELKAGVIDKDLSAAIVARQTSISKLVIVTGAQQVALNFHSIALREYLDFLTPEMIQRYILEEQFPAGSMGPKAKATAIFTQEDAQNEAWITGRENLLKALFEIGEGSGTRIISSARLKQESENIVSEDEAFISLLETGTLTKLMPILTYLIKNNIPLTKQYKEVIASLKERFNLPKKIVFKISSVKDIADKLLVVRRLSRTYDVHLNIYSSVMDSNEVLQDIIEEGLFSYRKYDDLDLLGEDEEVANLIDDEILDGLKLHQLLRLKRLHELIQLIQDNPEISPKHSSQRLPHELSFRQSHLIAA